jgi:hypothetical protein
MGPTLVRHLPWWSSVTPEVKLSEQSMTFTIHASKDGGRAETQRIRPAVAAAKARSLAVDGWDVYVTDLAGRNFSFAELDDLLDERGRTAPPPRRD